MSLLDRYIVSRFLWNFVVLFALLFVFGLSVDLALQIHEFTAYAANAVDQGRSSSAVAAFAWGVFSFYGPRVFQFYAYLSGMIAVAAMGFTFGQMNRNRELVALLSAGVGLHRVALPVLAAALGLNVIQLANQELVLPRLAPLLVRDHGDLVHSRGDDYPVELTRDAAGNLVMARAFDPSTRVLDGLLVLERNRQGTASRRLSAISATWNADDRCWMLEEGWATERRSEGGADWAGWTSPEPIDRYCTDLGPEGIAVRHSALYGQMLSLTQIRDMERHGGADPAQLARYRYSRLAAVLVNLLMLAITLPSFLRRLPSNLLRQSVIAAALTVPGLLGAFVGMTMSLPGIPPAVGVFLPVAILVPVAMARLSMMET